MDQYHAYLLDEMGITPWQLNASPTPSPAAMPTASSSHILVEQKSAMTSPLDLSHYEIAIIGEPAALNSDFVVAVLKSMQLEPSQAKVLSMAEFSAYQGAMPTWLWSTQGEVKVMPNCKVLNSPSIAQTSQDQEAKRALWSQIKSQLSVGREG